MEEVEANLVIVITDLLMQYTSRHIQPR